MSNSILFYGYWASLVAQTVNRLPTVRETRVRSLGWEDPLEKEMAIHSSTLAWKIPWTDEPGRLQSTGLQSDKTEQLHFMYILWFIYVFISWWTFELFLLLAIINNGSMNSNAQSLYAHVFISLHIYQRVEYGHMCCSGFGISLGAQMVKNPPSVLEAWVLSLGWEEPLEDSMATHSSVLVWRRHRQSRRQRSLEGHSPRGHRESDTTEWLSTAQWFLSFLPSSFFWLILIISLFPLESVHFLFPSPFTSFYLLIK